MRILFKDYETYFDDECSIRTLGRTRYINHPDFEIHGACFAIDNSDFFWVDGDDIPYFIEDVSPYVDAYCAHNGLFDHYITWRHCFKERKFLLDTYSMAIGALMRRHPGLRLSLSSLGKFYFPENPELWKDEFNIQLVKGMRKGEIPPHLFEQFKKYCLQDGEAMRAIFRKLIAENEPWHITLDDIDTTLAMGCYPQMEMNLELADELYRTELAAKEKAALELNVDRATLRSSEKLAALYRSLGVEPPTKLNPKGDRIYAFAKNDEDMQELLDHENPYVCALTALRLEEKSAQTMTRSKVFSLLPRELPVPLKYSSAHTGRMGGDEYNLQNPNKKSRLRECIRAPEGHKLVVVDASQIELRGTAWLTQEQWILEALAEDRSVYAEVGTDIFGYPISKKTHPEPEFHEYFCAKRTVLSCQYGVGEDKLLHSFKGDGFKEATIDIALRCKKGFRAKCKRIVNFWYWLDQTAIPVIAGLAPAIEYMGLRFEKDRIILPSGRSIWYCEMHMSEDGEWKYKYVSPPPKATVFFKKIWGGSMLENIIQALSYDVFMFHSRIAKREVFRNMAMPVHDEGVYVIPDNLVQPVLSVLLEIEKINPPWMAGVTLKGEGGFGQTYAEAK